MELKSIKLKRHESFSIREGWLEKGIIIISEDKNCFSKEEGTVRFGIGTNMVKSLKYWLEACNIAKFKNGAYLTEFGELLLNYDKYLENIFSWWMIHLFLVTNKEMACVFNLFFNMEYTRVEKETLFNYLKTELSKEYDLGADSSLEGDIAVLFRTYYSNDDNNPEQNLRSPLSKLSLVKYQDKKYLKTSPKVSELNYLIVYYSLIKLIDETNDITFNLEDLLKQENNPLRIFNISNSALMIYLDEMKKNGLINIIKTAGLNTLKIEKKLSLSEIFEKYYCG